MLTKHFPEGLLYKYNFRLWYNQTSEKIKEIFLAAALFYLIVLASDFYSFTHQDEKFVVVCSGILKLAILVYSLNAVFSLLRTENLTQVNSTKAITGIVTEIAAPVLMITAKSEIILTSDYFCNHLNIEREKVIGNLLGGYMEIEKADQLYNWLCQPSGNFSTKITFPESQALLLELQPTAYQLNGQTCFLANVTYAEGSQDGVFRYQEIKVLQQQLFDEQVSHKTELARAISNAQEAERKNISEELHDNACQVLGGVKLFIEHCLTNEVKNDDLLRESANLVNDVINELRKMAHCYSPHFVEEFGLVSGLNELAYFAGAFKKINVTLNTDQFDDQLLPDSKKLLLYRIAQEQFNNIMKHAKATQIDVFVRSTGSSYFFSVHDNGVGTELTGEKEGLGLKNIRNRAELLNAQVQFISSPGQGFGLQLAFDAA